MVTWRNALVSNAGMDRGVVQIPGGRSSNGVARTELTARTEREGPRSSQRNRIGVGSIRTKRRRQDGPSPERGGSLSCRRHPPRNGPLLPRQASGLVKGNPRASRREPGADQRPHGNGLASAPGRRTSSDEAWADSQPGRERPGCRPERRASGQRFSARTGSDGVSPL